MAALQRIGLDLRLPVSAQGGPADFGDSAAATARAAAAQDAQVTRGVESI